MKAFRPQSAVEQLTGHLREEIWQGSLSGEMPGVNQLAASMGCSARTVHAALKLLEREGLLEGRGAGCRRRIVLPDHHTPPRLRVKILLYERGGEMEDYILKLRHQLDAAGHTAVIASQSLLDLGMDAERVARYVTGVEADAWVVVAGSGSVLEWFAAQPVPAFSLFGRQTRVDLAGAGPRKDQAVRVAVSRLVSLGHTRIVYLTREERRQPGPGLSERAFLEELEKHGVAVGPYNLPDWADNPRGFRQCLSSLFRTTPPTALFTSGIELFTAAQQFLLREGIRVPHDVSMVCCDPHPVFAWSDPPVAHIRFDTDIWVRHIMNWVKGVASGRCGRRKTLNDATFVEGGTIGQAAGTY